MKLIIPQEAETPEPIPQITEEDVERYVTLWKDIEEIQKKFDAVKEELVGKFKAGAVSPTLATGITLAFKNYMSKSTSYQTILNKVKEWLGQQAQEGKTFPRVLLGYMEQWYMECTKESERNVITPKVEQVVTVTKAVKLNRTN
jgi:hypothetical protein